MPTMYEHRWGAETPTKESVRTTMPYADEAMRRKVKRESMQRSRAAACGPGVDPAPITSDDLAMAGRVLDRRKAAGESDAQYHAALRALWRRFLSVVEG
jgi:hypothetical protein